MTNFIVTTMNEMFQQQDQRLDGIEKEQSEMKKEQIEMKKEQTKIKKNQTKQLDISLQVVDELKAMRLEQAAQTNHNSRTNDDLEYHGKRITILEQNYSTI